MSGRTGRKPARETVRNSLVDAGLLTLEGAVAGIDPAGPDAALLADIVHLADWSEQLHAAWRQARNSAERKAIALESRGRHALENRIAETVPVTVAGLRAKLEAAVERMGGVKDATPGTLWYMPLLALRDALAPGSPLWGPR